MTRQSKRPVSPSDEPVGKDLEGQTRPEIKLDLQTVETGGEELDSSDDRQMDLATELAQAKMEAARFKDRWHRATADLENYRKRVARERDRDRLREKARLLNELLEMLDIFDKALNAEYENIEQAREGMVRILTNLTRVMKKEGLEPVPAQGLPFDASNHEALKAVTTNEVEPGTVLEEVQLGYTLEGQLLRPAKVIVAKAPSLEELDQENQREPLHTRARGSPEVLDPEYETELNQRPEKNDH